MLGNQASDLRELPGQGAPEPPEVGGPASPPHPLHCAASGSPTGGPPWLPHLLAHKFVCG